MSAVTQYRRDVLNYLRDEYGVRDAKIHTTTGGHRRLRFTYLGVPRAMTLHDSQSHFRGAGSGVLALKLQDIRRELGSPPPRPEATNKRSLTDMTTELLARVPEPAADSAPSNIPARGAPALFSGRVALLKTPRDNGRRRLSISIPDDLYRAFDHAGRIGVALNADGTYEIRKASSGKAPRFHQWFTSGEWSTIIEVDSDAPLYGTSPAEFLLDPTGTILVNVPEATRVPVKVRLMKQKDIGTTGQPLDEPSSPTQPQKTTGGAASAPESDPASEMRDILARIREVESRSPYRLQRVRAADGSERLRWTAPAIE